jgi:hypothetical protein
MTFCGHFKPLAAATGQIGPAAVKFDSAVIFGRRGPDPPCRLCPSPASTQRRRPCPSLLGHSSRAAEAWAGGWVVGKVEQWGWDEGRVGCVWGGRAPF